MPISSEKDIFDHFGLNPDGTKRPIGGTGPTVEELSAKLAALEADNQRLSGERQSLLAQKAAPAQAWQPQPLPELSLDGLPDAFVDAAGYNKALAERFAAHTKATLEIDRQNAQAAARQQQESTSKVDRLWQGFEKAHPDLASQRELIEFAASKVAAEAAAKGVDVERYLFATPETFYNDVVARAKALNPTIGAKQPEEQQTDDLGLFQGGPGMPEGRTGGISGGEESGFKPSAAGSEKPGDMIEDLKKIQKASGFW